MGFICKMINYFILILILSKIYFIVIKFIIPRIDYNFYNDISVFPTA